MREVRAADFRDESPRKSFLHSRDRMSFKDGVIELSRGEGANIGASIGFAIPLGALSLFLLFLLLPFKLLLFFFSSSLGSFHSDFNHPGLDQHGHSLPRFNALAKLVFHGVAVSALSGELISTVIADFVSFRSFSFTNNTWPLSHCKVILVGPSF